MAGKIGHYLSSRLELKLTKKFGKILGWGATGAGINGTRSAYGGGNPITGVWIGGKTGYGLVVATGVGLHVTTGAEVLGTTVVGIGGITSARVERELSLTLGSTLSA